jgi:hypothetical protein
MDGHAVLESHHPEILTQFIDIDPVADATVRLNLSPDWTSEGTLTPLTMNVGALSQYLMLEVRRGLHEPPMGMGLVNQGAPTHGKNSARSSPGRLVLDA